MNWNARFSDAASRIADADAVIGILKLAEQPGIISLAGGLPDPRVFRIEETREAMAQVLTGPRPRGAQLLAESRDHGTARVPRDADGPHRAHPVQSPEEILVCSGGLEGIRHCLQRAHEPRRPRALRGPDLHGRAPGLPGACRDSGRGFQRRRRDDPRGPRRHGAAAGPGGPCLPGSSTWDRASRTRRAAPGASSGAAKCWKSRNATTWRWSRTTPTGNFATRGSGCRRSSRSRPSG